MQVSSFLREELCRNQHVGARITWFLQYGIRVLQYCAHQSQSQVYNRQIDVETVRWQRTIKRVSESKPVFLFGAREHD